MPSFAQISALFSHWIDAIALLINAQLERLGSRRQIRLIEEAGDQFRLHAVTPDRKLVLPDHTVRISDGVIADPLPDNWTTAFRGSRVEILMRPSRFLFQPLELPKRAAEFLGGIVRTQIDRLTPWSPGEAAFSWTAPTDIPNDRIALTVGATARAMIEPYLQAVVDLGAAAVAVATTPPGDSAATPQMTMLEHKAGGVIDLRRIRQALIGVLLAAGLATAASLAVAAVMTDSLDAEQQQLQQAIAKRRTAVRLSTGGAAASGQSALEHRKQTTPSSVIVIEALSGLLPDHTYVTELRIEGDKVQIVGVTHDAPSLIQLIEQSPYFTRATFFAPTTRSPEDPGERFHIEARIKPHFS